MKKLTLAAIGVLVLTAGSLLAHHSYGLFYDIRQTVILKGKVAKVSFKEPHVMLTIETKNSGIWEAEWTGVMGLMRQGISENTIRVGDSLEIEPESRSQPRLARGVRSEGDPAPRRRMALGEHAKWPGPRVIE